MTQKICPNCKGVITLNSMLDKDKAVLELYKCKTCSKEFVGVFMIKGDVANEGQPNNT